MTANQAIILLKIYRDSDADGEPQEFTIVRQFQERGLIERAFVHGTRIIRSPEGDKWVPTAYGDKVVKLVLGSFPFPKPEVV